MISDEELRSIEAEMKKITPHKTKDCWTRCGESSKYWLDYDETTADSRLVNKKTNKVAWSYYGDVYTG